jgi:methylenetetrahydrofolate--tRNA-(uracil-5-)-methyltransferase
MKNFQPMKANFGILPPLEVDTRGKRERGAAHAERAAGKLERFLSEIEQ